MKIVNRKSRVWFVVCGVLILSIVSASWMLSTRTLDSHECFVSVTAREMFESGDWILPTLNGHPRINKTPLCYWLVAGLAKIMGGVDELTARLPSDIFAVLSAVAILYFVNKWLSFRVAAISSCVWVTSLSYFRCSHSARPDMALAFFVILCLLSFYSAVIASTRRTQTIYILIFWVSFGLGNLAKGPAPVAYVLVPVFSYIVAFRQWKMPAKLLPVIGPIIFLVILLPWPLAIAHRMNWDIMIWKREFVDRLYGDYAPGHFPIYYYFGDMFKYIMPWFAFLPMALAAPFFKVWEKKQPVMKFLWLWFVTGIVFLTVNVCKRQHYILPLMPAMAILIGILLEDMAFVRKAYTPRFARNVLKGHIIAIIAGAVGGAIYFTTAMPHFVTFVLLLSIVATVASLTVAILFSRGKTSAACAIIFSSIVIWIMICDAGFSTALDVDRYARDFAQKVARIVPQSDKLVAYRAISSRFVQYFGKIVPDIQDKSLLYEKYEQGNWIVCTFDLLNELAQDNRLRKIYYERQRGKEDTGGALFHKSAAVVENKDNNDHKDKSILPGQQ